MDPGHSLLPCTKPYVHSPYFLIVASAFAFASVNVPQRSQQQRRRTETFHTKMPK
jgi:hypothetical protein